MNVDLFGSSVGRGIDHRAWSSRWRLAQSLDPTHWLKNARTASPHLGHSLADLRRVTYATLGCETDTCAQTFFRALERIKLPIPETIGDMRKRDEKTAKLEARSKAGKEARAELKLAKKRK